MSPDHVTQLAEARELTLAVVGGLDDSDLDRVLDPVMSPIAWDLGHIAAFEDLWLVHEATGAPLLKDELSEVYDATLSPRRDRPALPWLRSGDAFTYLERVRERTLDSLAGPTPASDQIVELVIRHELQHLETILQTVQLARVGWEPDLPAPSDEVPPATAARGGLTMIEVEGGPFARGAGPKGFAYDNERPKHETEVASFQLAATPVLNGEWQDFIDQGGYRREDLWTEEGLEWLADSGVTAPGGWAEGGEWRAGSLEPLDPLRPAVHLNAHEAEAFARLHGARLPTEAEWEFAATTTAAKTADASRTTPGTSLGNGGGSANLDMLARGTRRIEAAEGPLAMIGDVWEWTASTFEPYPGFEWHPYRDYSEPHFGPEHRVLRGGSWATHQRVASATFRNWDLPVRRQIFSGVRIARDVD
ncbi:MAG: SUMF1/EgtB/PvdO family nonheme iron enzyme [Actinomycetes bacterium]